MPRIVLLALVAFAACHPAQVRRPVQFLAPAQQDPIAALTRALVVGGQSVAHADPQTGILQTRWENTGFLYGFIDVQKPFPRSVGAQIWRRYSVVLAPREGELDVTVRADTQRCAEGAQTADGIAIDGVCTTLFTEGLVPQHQKQLDALGLELRTALGGKPSPSAP
ncbi:MAG: hypothetical protein HY901_16430 [Deltaproteobacteria bacterium]|nr:hypothetical protein [Deltaproteobacteria bacterium]